MPPSINDLIRGKNKPDPKRCKKGATKSGAAKAKRSSGAVSSKNRSKNQLDSGSTRVIHTPEGAVCLVQVDKRGREKVVSAYIPDSFSPEPSRKPRAKKKSR